MASLRKFAIVGALLAIGCVPSVTAPPQSNGVDVLRVFDGDTIEVRIEGETVTVRLDGINAPDRGECFYEEASALLRELVGGESVLLEVTGTDQFDRTLAVVWLEGRSVNLEMVVTGNAIATTPLLPGMGDAESSAMLGGIGLWGSEACGHGPIPAVEIDFAGSVIDPPGPDHEHLDQELVRFFNPGPEPLDLTGWVLRDESSRHRYHFPPNTTIGPGESFVVRSSDRGWDPGRSAVWNNDGDIIILLDSFGRVVTARRY